MEKKITRDHKGARLSVSYGRGKEAPDSVVTTEQTAGTDLHARIREALQERLALAQAAAGATNRGTWHEPASGVLSVGDGDLDELIPTSDSRLSRHMVANDPASTIRRAERDLRTLERHAPEPSAFRPGAYDCTYCIDTEGRPEPAPCVEVRELAAGEGIEVSDGR